jgi:molecular chaperone GrpE
MNTKKVDKELEKEQELKDQELSENNSSASKKSSRKAKKPRGKTEKLKYEIEELKEQLAEAEEKILRLRAEYDNYRKRASREIVNAGANAKADTIMPILQVYDHFKMAVAAADSSDDMEVVKQGLSMIRNEFTKAMEDLGVKEINSVGQKFDPLCHDAVATEPSEEEEETVIKQWQSGYKLGEKILRPATVVVSSGPAGNDSADDEPEEEESE